MAHLPDPDLLRRGGGEVRSLRGLWDVLGGRASIRPGVTLCWLWAGGAGYGLVLGSRNLLLAGRLDLQPLFSALKVPLLSLITFALCLPSFYVLNALLGLRADFGPVLSALVRAQAVFGLALVSLAPLTALCYVSDTSYGLALLFNAGMFALASLAAQVWLRRFYVPLVARRPRHRWALRLWLGLYAFTGVQLGWVLRPFVGSPHAPSAFLREEAWSNAYVVVLRLVRGALGVG